jgi:hypothetical protein
MCPMRVTMSASSVPAGVVSAGQGDEPGRRRWFVLGLVGLAQLMIVLDGRARQLTCLATWRTCRESPWRARSSGLALVL